MNEQTIFTAALELEPSQRGAFLDEACGNRSELRQRVEKLLQLNEGAGRFMEQPAAVAVATFEQPPTERPGTMIGPYKLLQQIGEGGMGVVYMAEQTEPVQRKVALKVIKPGMDSRQVIARFEAERQALAMMDHVNIARVLDAGTIQCGPLAPRADMPLAEREAYNGRPYFVMELVHGVPITKYCDDNRLTPRQRLELFVPVCQAIQHAHQKGIIHRDIKPSNVMVTLYDGQPVPKVIDFGVAKATEQKLTERTLFTQYGTMVGTLEYMSPEQAEMSALGVDTRSDIYSLGVLLYELLTGSTPLSSKRMKEAAYGEILRLIKEEEPPKPSTRLSESDEALASIAAQRHTEPAKLSKLMRGELDWIVMKTLEKDRNHRYETANGFAMDVQRYLADEPVQACPPSALYRFRKFARRNKRALATMTVTAVAVLVTMVALAVSNVLIQRETAQKEEALNDKTEALGAAQASEQNAKIQAGLAKANADKAETERRIAKAQEKITKQEELTARRRFYAAQTNLAMQAWEAGDPARTLEVLETQRPKFDQEDLRSFEWYYLWRLCHRGLRTRLQDRALVVVFLPGGKTLASTVGGSIILWDVTTAQEKARWQAANAWGLSVSPDGKLLGSWGESDPTRVWDTTSGQQVAVFEGTTAPTFSPDGKLIAVARKTDIEFWDLATRQRHAVLRRSESDSTDNVMGLGSFVFAPNAKMAIARVNETLLRIYRWDGANWQPGGEISNPVWFLPVAFSPDSQTFAVGGNVLKLYAADTGKELSTPIGHTGIVYSVAFSPDGKSLASAGGDRTVRVWDLATRKQQTSYPHPGPVYSVAYSSDGKQLASAGAYGTLRVWDTVPVEAPSVLQRGANGIAFFPDGKTLAASGAGITLWDVATGKESATFGNAGYGLLAMSHDGNRLAVTHGALATEVHLWDLATRQQYAVLEGHSKWIYSLAFSPDDKTLATASYDMTVRLWDVATRETRLTLKPGRNMSSVAFSPDGRTLATGSVLENVQLWDVATGRALLTLQEVHRRGEVGPWCWSVAFSPDGKILAAASQSGLVRLWDTATGRLCASLQGHTASVNRVAFSPDGNTLATASDDRTIRLWDTATGQEKITLKGDVGAVRTIAFSRDGATLATASADGTVRLWRTSREPEATALRTEFNPDDPNTVAALTDAESRLRSAGRLPEARQANEAALARLEMLAAAFPNEPKSAVLNNDLAWLLATCPDPKFRNAARAVELGKKAVELSPTTGGYWNTLGVAHYRAGDWQDAIGALKKSDELLKGESFAFNAFFLAMAHWRLDEKDEARKWYDQAAAWMDKNQPENEELRRFRAEAEELMGIKQNKE